MNTIQLEPARLEGEISIPPSKSLAHRALICAGLAEGVSTIERVALSEDLLATLEGIQALGAKILERKKDSEGTFSLAIQGAGYPKKASDSIHCRESGSTLRFLLPLAALLDEKITLTGAEGLARRPLDLYYDLFKKQGLSFSEQRGLPLVIQGRLKPDRFELRGDVSSQFVSGLLFALPLLEGDSTLVLTSPLESRAYVDLTLWMLEKSGIEIEHQDDGCFRIPGGQKYKPFRYRVEGDYSQAAFWIVGGLLGGDICCRGLNFSSLQGDKAILEIAREMGGVLRTEGELLQVKKSLTRGTILDASQYPDLIPILSLLAARSRGETRIINGKRLRIKESDRLHSTAAVLGRLGANIRELEDGLWIQGVSKLQGGATVDSFNDHRIAMMVAMASLACEAPIVLTNAQAVGKSYPDFWETFRKAVKHG